MAGTTGRPHPEFGRHRGRDHAGHARADEAVFHRPARGGPLRYTLLRTDPTCSSGGRLARRDPTRRPGSSSFGGCSANASADRARRTPREQLFAASNEYDSSTCHATVLVVRADEAARGSYLDVLDAIAHTRRQSLSSSTRPPEPLETPGRAGRSGQRCTWVTAARPDGISAARNPLLAWGRVFARCNSSSAGPRPTPTWR